MRYNFEEWVNHYQEFLWEEYCKFNIFLEENNCPATEFIKFSVFIYQNTKKYKHSYLDKLVAPLR